MKKLLNILLLTMIVGLFASSSSLMAQPANNDCVNAEDISNAFDDSVANSCAVQVMGPFSNVGATVAADEITITGLTGTETSPSGGGCCLCEANTAAGDLQGTVWFSFTPANTGDYFIEAIAQSSSNGCGGTLGTFEDTQLIIYSSSDGTCGGLTFVDCNEDGPSSAGALYPAGLSVNLTSGTTYYMMVDEYAALEGGEFCVEVTSQACAVCPNNNCEAGETYATCPDDCPCTVEGNFITWDPAGGAAGTGGYALSAAPVIFCAEDVPVENGLNPSPEVAYIMLVVAGESLTDVDGNGRGEYDITTTEGTLYDTGATPAITTMAEDNFIFYLTVTQADIDAAAGGITFVSVNGDAGACVYTFGINWPVDVTGSSDIASLCPGNTACGDNICDAAISEDFCTCPNDCTADCAELVGVFAAWDGAGWTGSATPTAYCAEPTTGEAFPTGDSYIPFAIFGYDCLNYNLTSSAGTVYRYDGVTAGSVAPNSSVPDAIIAYLAIAESDLAAGPITITAVDSDTGQSCSTTLEINTVTPVYTNLLDILPGAEAPCGADCGTPFTVTAFEVFSNESYILPGVIAGNSYIVDICTGTGAGSWTPELSAISPNGTVDGTSGGNCSLSFTASEDGDYIILIEEQGGCFGATNPTDNGNLTVQCDDSASAAVCPNRLAILVNLEGIYDAAGDTMLNTFAAVEAFPLAQPYSGMPWNYAGTEAIASAGDASSILVDWVLVELYDPATGMLSDSQACLLTTSGIIIGTDGYTPLFSQASSDKHLIVRHRNHVDIVSNLPVTIPGGIDMTDPQNVMGGTGQLTAVGTSFAMNTGDGNGDGVITYADFNAYTGSDMTPNVYSPGDYSMDANITIDDYNAYYNHVTHIGLDIIRY